MNEVLYKYKMDANESPFKPPSIIVDKLIEDLRKLDLNRYPDTESTSLRKAIESYIKADYRNIVVGNGSDDLIKLIISSFVHNGDVVLSHSPTFTMYSVASRIARAKYFAVDTDEAFNLDIRKLIDTSNNMDAKVIFICSPNNPTGNVISREQIFKILRKTKSILVVDEAYIEFGGTTVIHEVMDHDRLIVLRTLSKAFGMAGIRMGYLVANDKLINSINKVKPPYNLNSLTQTMAEHVINNHQRVLPMVELVKANRDKMLKELSSISGIKPYPSQANFILIRVKDAQRVYNRLLSKGYLVRIFSQIILRSYIRVTVGSEKENEGFIEALKEVVENEES